MVHNNPVPNFDKEVLKPLRIEQAQEAAAEAAQAAADALAAQQAQVTSETAYSAPAQPSGDCGSWMVAAGIIDQSIAILVINRESGCSPSAVNSESGACGIGQQLPCGKWPHAWNDPVGGMVDMQNYVFSVYGSWANAWAHEQNYGYY